MKNLIAYRNPSGLKNLLSFIIAITFMIVWLPFVRSIFDGSSYQWGTSYFGLFFGGKGVDANFIFLIIQLLFYVALFTSMYWVKVRTWFYGLLGVWFINVFGNLLADIAINGNTMFHGDTLNVHVSVTWIVIPLSILALTLLGLVINQDMKAEEVRLPWSLKNKLFFWFVLGPIPLIAVLLSIGEPHGITDQIGVIMSIAQCFLLPLVYKSYKQQTVHLA